ncbi:winged helix-turn-helix domain-containing protein [Streptomyces sp. DSM 44915]|uniref:Winged helix-turn-helix domain-containing protein n=1 Tax=Streptomyces chisholmiae TaxID=3075540 RepID=A0ABU2K042_9ACTN|nr:winged helix-turn-helix domain-containing protein [Streptomyces sp. DSM 44915]MDT0270369.1 winged helix-turn-helix domain-containing protein [Streptomyces sp. DSM 44915]
MDVAELAERVAALEARLAALEAREAPAPAAGATEAPEPTERAHGGDFWALEGLKSRLRDTAPDGGVLFTGAVRLPTDERYEWQYGQALEALLDADWALTAESLAALGHPVRLRLLRAVLAGRRTAGELAELPETGTTGQIYHHLRQLAAAGWLTSAGRGQWQVPPVRVVPLLVAVTAARP